MRSTDLLVLRIKSLLAEKTGVSENRVTLDTRLAEDLHLTGPAAEAFLQAFFVTFGVTELDGSPVSDRVRPGSKGFIARIIGRGSESPLRVADLVRAAETGVWLGDVGD